MDMDMGCACVCACACACACTRPANFVVVEAICYAKTEYSSARVSGGHNMSQSLRPICKLLMARAYSIQVFSGGGSSFKSSRLKCCSGVFASEVRTSMKTQSLEETRLLLLVVLNFIGDFGMFKPALVRCGRG